MPRIPEHLDLQDSTPICRTIPQNLGRLATVTVVGKRVETYVYMYVYGCMVNSGPNSPSPPPALPSHVFQHMQEKLEKPGQ